MSLDIENTGAFIPVKCFFRFFASPSEYPWLFKVIPTMESIASWTIGIPVTFEINGIVRLDLGLTSIRALSKAIKTAGTIILNGPAGVFELPDFALGTIEMINACAETSGYVVVGGGHTATMINQRGLGNRMGHVSTGGGASLKLLSGEKLEILKSWEKYEK